MPWKDAYNQKDGVALWRVDGSCRNDVIVKSGDLKCHKCGRKIPDTEMFCIPCFGEQAESKPRTKRIKPDEGGLFDGIGGLP